ncbi:hypothetical protein PtA15_1A317 [Puccinia triticina]|uniref:Uncharacterized protein n=1 Tax=Puccinia triticina TaxID=208348 RepID=A0ABY7C8F3_9BASI|nr:uncharacterized protein PtA15_1A317 [Puccinia triticina]WAQ80979.1 hypothetical protein PtA15_1A317 [Puccinia triticina]
MAEQIVQGFFWCSLASLAVVGWTSHSIFLSSILATFLELLSILKIFGIALLAVITLGLAIVLWEQVLSKTHLWHKLSTRFSPRNPDTADIHPGPHEQASSPDEQRSILPVVILIIGLGTLALLDTSFLFPARTPPSTHSSDHQASKPPVNHNKSVIQFFSAVLTLALVVGFIVFNKDEYRAWKARRRLSKHHRRRPRQEHSPTHSPPK